MKKIIQNPLALSGLIIIVSVLFIAIFAPWLSPYDPNFIDIHSILLPMPEIAKIDSPITEPPIKPGIDKPIIVISGSSVFLRACL